MKDWTSEDWRLWLRERAAIMEFDGGLSRPEAEAAALAEQKRLKENLN